MAITNRNLEPGIKLIARYKGNTYHGLVTDGEDRQVRYQLTPHHGKEYKSLSSLGTAVTGKPCNGWAFWSIDSSETGVGAATPEVDAAESAPAEVTEFPEVALLEGAASPGELAETTYLPLEEEDAPPTTTGSFRRVPNQKGVPNNYMRVYCDTCRSSFNAPMFEAVTACPQGHSPA